MKTILSLIAKDFRRDWKHPWSILLFAALPLIMTSLIAAIFGGGGGKAGMPVIHLAVMDQDDDFLTGILRGMPSQGDASQKLKVQFVKTREEGIRTLENRKASAFVIFPKNMTEDLLNGRTNSIELYENPAEQIIPKVVSQGVSLLACGLSAAADILGEPLRDIRKMAKAGEFPAETAIMATASGSYQQLKGVRRYLFPPIVQFTNINAADYVIATNTVEVPHE